MIEKKREKARGVSDFFLYRANVPRGASRGDGHRPGKPVKALEGAGANQGFPEEGCHHKSGDSPRVRPNEDRAHGHPERRQVQPSETTR